MSEINITLLYLTKEVTCNYRVVLEGEDWALRDLFLSDLSGVVKCLSVKKPVGHSLEEIFHLEKFPHVWKTVEKLAHPTGHWSYLHKAKSNVFQIVL